MIDFFLQTHTWIALLTLSFLEIVLGIDNVIFISILVNRLKPDVQKKATFWGLFLAMVQRVILLFFTSFLIRLGDPFFSIELSFFETHLSWQTLILLIGGIFLLYKGTKEMYEKMEDKEHDIVVKSKSKSLTNALLQISLIDLIFSVDSILTAVGMTSGFKDYNQALAIMIIAVVIAIIIMMFYANPVREFIKKHPSIQMLGLAFLLLIGFMLIAEAAHISHTKIFGKATGAVPKGYLYFAIGFSIFVEYLNIRSKKK